MRVIEFLIIALFFIISWTSLIGCQSNAIQDQNNSITKPNLIITNYSDEYEFITFLNDEPIFRAGNRASCNWQGYPLIKGKNELRIIFSQKNKINELEIETWLDVAILDGEEYKYEYLRDKFKKEKQLERAFLFEHENVEVGNGPYKLLSSMEQSAIISDIENLTLYLVKLLAARDYATFAKKIGLQGEKEILYMYPKWLLEEEEKKLRINHISSPDDFDIVIGERLILVKPSKIFLKNSGSDALCTIEKMQSDEIGSLRYLVPCFVFAMQNDRWCLLEEGNPHSISK